MGTDAMGANAGVDNVIASAESAVATRQRKIGGVILALENISLAFGGVQALSDVSFDVREHEIRAIIGPNGAGKSSMLNVINGVYHPQHGTISFKGEKRHQMNPHKVASQYKAC